jgi:hypothetical protein
MYNGNNIEARVFATTLQHQKQKTKIQKAKRAEGRGALRAHPHQTANSTKPGQDHSHGASKKTQKTATNGWVHAVCNWVHVEAGFSVLPWETGGSIIRG